MELSLPMNYVELNQEEMMYFDGGLYVNNETINAIAFAIGTTANTTIPATIGAIQIGAAFIAAKLSVVPGGNVIAWVGAAYIAANAGSIAPAFVSALFRQRGMDIGIDWWYALPVLSFSAR